MDDGEGTRDCSCEVDIGARRFPSSVYRAWRTYSDLRSDAGCGCEKSPQRVSLSVTLLVQELWDRAGEFKRAMMYVEICTDIIDRTQRC